MSSTAADLKTAQADLDALRAELPSFHALVEHNEAAAARLKAERAAPDVQAKARGRTSTARELLAEHQADIADAEARVAALNQQLETEATCRRIKKLEREIAEGRADFADRAHAAYEQIIRAAFDLRADRSRFVEAAAEAESLRERLRDLHQPSDRELAPHEVRELFNGLGVPRVIDHHPPRSWNLRLFTGTNANSPLKTRLVGLIDNLVQAGNLDADQLELERR
jgi:chromosome segregation ATPase